MKEVEWLVDCSPREAQLEALRRSYYGYALKDHKDDEGTYRWLRDRPARGWGHFMEMRLGKTPTSLNELLLFHQDYGVSRGVVFSPNSYKMDWVLEAEKFGVSLSIPFFPFELSHMHKAEEFLRQCNGQGVLVVNYEAMQHTKGLQLIADHISGKGSIVFADESIKIKNHQSIATKNIMNVTKETSVTRILTGKPMTQGPQDLYPQLRLARNLDGTNFYSFRNRYCKMGGFKNKKVTGIKNEEMLQDLIASTAFVAKRKDWGKITVPEFSIEKLTVSPEQKKHYDELEKDFMTMLENGDVVSVDQVVSKLMKQQQISSGFIYNEDGKAVSICTPDKLPKMVRLLEIMEESESKVIVPYHYNASGDILAEALAPYNPAFIRSKGWMKKNEKDTVAEKLKFNSDPSCRVIILNLDAGKYGHDLSGREGDRCTVMAFYENSYSLDTRSQIEMRNTASSQDWTNLYLDFVATKTEAAAIKALVHKENLVKAVFGAYGIDRWSGGNDEKEEK